MRRNVLTYVIAAQSIVAGLWLAFHNGKENYTDSVQGFEHVEFLNHPWFYVSAILLGGLLIFASIRKKERMKRWLMVLLNGMWAAYTAVLIINELNGVANMSWALFLGYNVAIYLAARYEVDA